MQTRGGGRIQKKRSKNAGQEKEKKGKSFFSFLNSSNYYANTHALRLRLRLPEGGDGAHGRRGGAGGGEGGGHCFGEERNGKRVERRRRTKSGFFFFDF